MRKLSLQYDLIERIPRCLRRGYNCSTSAHLVVIFYNSANHCKWLRMGCRNSLVVKRSLSNKKLLRGVLFINLLYPAYMNTTAPDY